MVRDSMQKYTEAGRGRYLWTLKAVYNAAHMALIFGTGVMGSNPSRRTSKLDTYCQPHTSSKT